ncbi:hypothetical protein ACFSKM_08630 [Ancylobacter dichloromethanicus]
MLSVVPELPEAAPPVLDAPALDEAPSEPALCAKAGPLRASMAASTAAEVILALIMDILLLM